MKWILIFASLSFQCTRFKRPSYCSAPDEYKNQTVSQIIENARKIVSDTSKEKRAIAFSVYGSDPKYTKGVLVNIDLAHELYPNWDVVIYFDKDVPKDIIATAKEKGAKVESCDCKFAAARFFIADKAYDRFIVRDADARLMFREVAAVADWIKNDWAILHGMRDTVGHTSLLLGGMWGAKTKQLMDALSLSDEDSLSSTPAPKTMEEYYRAYHSAKGANYYGLDEDFLADMIVKKVGEDKFLSHETILCNAFKHSKGFPLPRASYDLIGGAIDVE